MPRIFLCVGVALLAAPTAIQCQAPPNPSILYRTFQALAIGQVCRDSPSVCQDVGAESMLQVVDGGVTIAAAREQPLSAGEMESVYDRLRRDHGAALVAAEQSLVSSPLAPSSIGDLGIGGLGTAVVGGLTDFLLERARDEIVQSAFRDLRKVFEAHPDLRRLFPTVSSTLDAAAEISFQMLVPALRAAGVRDLEGLPVSLTNPQLVVWGGTVPWQVQTAGLVAQRVLDVSRRIPFHATMAELADVTEEQLSHAGVRAALRLLGVLAREPEVVSAAVGANANFALWVGNLSSDPIERVLADAASRRVMVSLLVHDVDFSEEVANVLAAGDEIIDRIVNAYNRIREIEGLIGDLRRNATQVDVMQAAAEAIGLVAALMPEDVRAGGERSLTMAGSLLEVIRDRQYGSFVASVLMSIPSSDDDKANEDQRQRLKRLVTFVAALAGADTPDGVRAALEAWADPVGSFRERRRGGAVQLSVVSYVGMATGWEKVLDVRPDSSLGGNFAGMFVPVGLEFSVGTGFGSFGIMGSILNVGTVASLRMSGREDAGTPDTLEVSQEAQFGLKQVFAPGLWLTVGVSTRYPLSVGLGAELAPRLRTVESGGAFVERNAVRWGVFLGVDLTLFRF